MEKLRLSSKETVKRSIVNYTKIAVFFLYIIGVLVRYFITFARYGKAFSRRTWQ